MVRPSLARSLMRCARAKSGDEGQWEEEYDGRGREECHLHSRSKVLRPCGRSTAISFFRATVNHLPGIPDSPLRSVALPCRSIVGASVPVKNPKPTASKQAVKAESPQNIHRQEKLRTTNPPTIAPTRQLGMDHALHSPTDHSKLRLQPAKAKIQPQKHKKLKCWKLSPILKAYHAKSFSLPPSVYLQPTLPAPRPSIHFHASAQRESVTREQSLTVTEKSRPLMKPKAIQPDSRVAPSLHKICIRSFA